MPVKVPSLSFFRKSASWLVHHSDQKCANWYGFARFRTVEYPIQSLAALIPPSAKEAELPITF